MEMHLLVFVSCWVKYLNTVEEEKYKNYKKDVFILYGLTTHEGCFFVVVVLKNLCLCFEVQQKVIYNIKGFNRLVKGSPVRDKNYFKIYPLFACVSAARL